mmetsp:Transcript_13764/g.27683  ORF Transcript_13764/g.27683 Transcript_13764/m.27683 type:complete len:229 (-) Transcript_13764:699-1385(-)
MRPASRVATALTAELFRTAVPTLGTLLGGALMTIGRIDHAVVRDANKVCACIEIGISSGSGKAGAHLEVVQEGREVDCVDGSSRCDCVCSLHALDALLPPAEEHKLLEGVVRVLVSAPIVRKPVLPRPFIYCGHDDRLLVAHLRCRPVAADVSALGHWKAADEFSEAEEEASVLGELALVLVPHRCEHTSEAVDSRGYGLHHGRHRDTLGAIRTIVQLIGHLRDRSGV